MNTKTKFWITLTCATFLAPSVFVPSALAAPQSKPYTPKAGSKERKAILDALRKPVEKEMKQEVVFYDVTMKVKNGWAYVMADGRDTKGKKLKQWAPEVDPTFQALLRQDKGKWKVLSWGAGTGMDATSEARKKYPKAPRSIFPSMPDDFPGDGPYSYDKGDGFNNKD